MAGEAKSTSFMLGSASVLIGLPANLWNLDPTINSIGLVKNFTMTSEPSYTDLSQGTKNSIVYSAMTSNTVKAQMEVYEYTTQNIDYALGLDGSLDVAQTDSVAITTASAVNDTTLVVNTGIITNFNVGDWVLIQNGADDQVYPAKITVKNNTVPRSLTFSVPLPKALPIGSTIRKVNMVNIGSKAEQPFFAAEIIGKLADGTDVRIMIPKLRITNGFTLGFTSDNYGNLPFEFTLYDLLPGDPFYTELAGKQAVLLART